MSNKIIKPQSTNDKSLAPKLNYVGNKTRVKYDGSCLKQDKIAYNHGTIVKIYIVYELRSTLNDFDPTSEKC